MKKLKDSIKAEMQKMVQKELSKVIVNQIISEDSFKDMMQEIISDFYEDGVYDGKEKYLSEGRNEAMNRFNRIQNIKNGKYKDVFARSVNYGNNPEKLEDLDVFEHVSTNFKEVGDSGQFKDIPKKGKLDLSMFQLKNKILINSPPSESGVEELKDLYKKLEKDGEEQIKYCKEEIKAIFDYIEKNKIYLSAISKKINEEDVGYFIQDGSIDDFSFKLEIKTNKETNQKIINIVDIVMQGKKISCKKISQEEGNKLLELAVEIYSRNSVSRNENPKKTITKTKKKKTVKSKKQLLFN